MGLSPYTAPPLSDDDVAPVRGLSHQGSHSGGGQNPRIACNWAFPMKIELVSMI